MDLFGARHYYQFSSHLRMAPPFLSTSQVTKRELLISLTQLRFGYKNQTKSSLELGSSR